MPPAKKATKAKKKIPARRATAKPRLLAGDNPQIAKGDGDAPVQAYIKAIPGWKQDVARRLDSIVTRTVPELRKAVKWNSPFYGVEGKGWFLSLHCFTKYVRLGFFNGTSMRPMPPGASSIPNLRYLDIRENDVLDEAQCVKWIKQASRMPGWLA